MSECTYLVTIKAEFGRKISAEEANEQFDAIEAAMGCLELQIEEGGTDETVHNYGSVDGTVIFDPAFGNLQYVTIEGDVEMSFSEPGESDYKVIYLVIADGGDGRYSFPDGSIWESSSHDPMDGKPYSSNGMGGEYGALVMCIHDGFGWVYVSFSRNDIDFTATAENADLYRWR